MRRYSPSCTSIRAAALLAAAALALSAPLIRPPVARSFPLCGAVSWVSGLAGKACTGLSNAPRLVRGAKKLLQGRPGTALKSVLGGGSSAAGAAASHAAAAATLALVTDWVVRGARSALGQTAAMLQHIVDPRVSAPWFSSMYWKLAGVAVMLTLPFLFASAIQAVVRGDLALLTRAAGVHLPMSLLAVALTAPMVMLLLTATDQVCSLVADFGGHGSSLLHATEVVAGAGAGMVVPFLGLLIALLTASCAVVLWMEMLLRSAAVYVVVLMAPLAFAALVWPARRMLAVRVLELLVALILSKLVVVSVLSLGGAALAAAGTGSLPALLAGATLLLLAALSPWAVLRLLPGMEMAASAGSSLAAARQEAQAIITRRRPAAGALASLTTAGPVSDVEQDEQDAEVDPDRTEMLVGVWPESAGAPARSDLGGSPGEPPAAGTARAERAAAPDPGPQSSSPGEEGEARLSPDPTTGWPDWEEMWQQPDMTWEPIVLGVEPESARRRRPSSRARAGTGRSTGRAPDGAAPDLGVAPELDPAPHLGAAPDTGEPPDGALGWSGDPAPFDGGSAA